MKLKRKALLLLSAITITISVICYFLFLPFQEPEIVITVLNKSSHTLSDTFITSFDKIYHFTSLKSGEKYKMTFFPNQFKGEGSTTIGQILPFLERNLRIINAASMVNVCHD